MSEVQCSACLNASQEDKTGRALRTEWFHIKVAEPPPPPAFVLFVEQAPNIERMMRGVMIACGLTREDIERLLKERREQMKDAQRLAS